MSPRLVLTLLLAAAGCASPQRRRAARRPPAVVALARRPAASAAAPRAFVSLPPATVTQLLRSQVDGPPMGTAHPFMQVVADRGARWITLCQAREDTNHDGEIYVSPYGDRGRAAGDRMRLYLVFGHGPGAPIDEFMGASSSGDYLAYERRGQLVLANATGSQRTALAAPRGARVEALDPFRAFDGTGRWYAYLRRARGGRAVVVVRELATGAESEVDPGPGTLGRVDFDPSGRWLEVEVYAGDTNGDGVVGASDHDAPSARVYAPCDPRPRPDSSTIRRDTSERRIARLGADRVARAVDGLVAPMNDRLLRRAPSGALIARALDGSEAEWAPARCDARVTQIDLASDRALVACVAPEPTRASLLVVGAGFRRALGCTMDEHLSVDWPFYAAVGGRLREFRDADGAGWLVDIASASAERVPRGYSAVGASYGARALFVEPGDGRLVALDSVLHAELSFGRAEPLGGRFGPLVFVGHRVVDIARGGVLGRFEGRPLAVDPIGRVLLARGPHLPRVGEFEVGPLVWTALRPDDS